MTLNGVMAVTLRYFTEFGKHTFQHDRRVDLWWNLSTSLLYFVVRVRCGTVEPLLWNSLDSNIKSVTSLNIFRRKLKNLLLS